MLPLVSETNTGTWGTNSAGGAPNSPTLAPVHEGKMWGIKQTNKKYTVVVNILFDWETTLHIVHGTQENIPNSAEHPFTTVWPKKFIKRCARFWPAYATVFPNSCGFSSIKLVVAVPSRNCGCCKTPVEKKKYTMGGYYSVRLRKHCTLYIYIPLRNGMLVVTPRIRNSVNARNNVFATSSRFRPVPVNFTNKLS